MCLIWLAHFFSLHTPFLVSPTCFLFHVAVLVRKAMYTFEQLSHRSFLGIYPQTLRERVLADLEACNVWSCYSLPRSYSARDVAVFTRPTKDAKREHKNVNIQQRRFASGHPPTYLIICWYIVCIWLSGREAWYLVSYGRMCKEREFLHIYCSYARGHASGQ